MRIVLVLVSGCLLAAVASTIGGQTSGETMPGPPPRDRRTVRWRRRMGDFSNSPPVGSSIATDSPNVTIRSTPVPVQPSTSSDENSESMAANNVDVKPASDHQTNFIAECNLPSKFGQFRLRSYSYSSATRSLDPIVLISGDVRGKENVLVRVHDQCFTSEVFGSKRCDCREQLQQSLKSISEQGGILIYLQQEGRGIGLPNKIAAYSLQDMGLDTVAANEHLGFNGEMREYYAVPDILSDLEVKSIRLITNNPYKINKMRALGVNIVERISIEIPPNPYNLQYLISKRDKMAHMLNGELKVETKRVGLDVQQDMPEVSLEASPAIFNKGYAFGKQTVEDAIAAVRRGEVVVVVDDEDRENEGDLIMAAEKATPESVGFIVRHSSGVVCISLEAQRLEDLNLPPMVVNNEDPKQTAYAVSVDYRHGTTTGISAADRAAAFRALVDPESCAADFQRPGHVFPLRYKAGGVLSRAGHTEASLDLTRLAGLRPGGVLAEIVNDDGSLARLETLKQFAARHNLVLTSVQDIIAYRYEIESLEPVSPTSCS